MSLLDALPLGSEFDASLAAKIEAKEDQIDRIENKLESLIEQQRIRLHQTMAKQPGLISFPGTRAKWYQQQQAQIASVQRLQDRLETVREIRDDVGVHMPRVEELALNKLKHEDPELVSGWEDMREAQRRHQALARNEEKKRKHTQDGRNRSSWLSLTRAISNQAE